MTPDQDLSARLADHLGKEAWYVDMLETQGRDYYDPPYEAKLKDATNKACGNAYRSGQLITIADHDRAVQAAVAKAVEAERVRTQAMHRRAQNAEGAVQAADNWLKWFEPHFLDAKRDGSEIYGRWLCREMVKALGRAAIRWRGVAG